MKKIILLVLLTTFIGCSNKSVPVAENNVPAVAPTAVANNTNPLDKLVVSTEPTGASSVVETKAKVKDGEEVIVHGRVKDFVKGYAVFTIADTSMKACIDNPEDACTTPWDYCCNPKEKIEKSVATVQLSDGGSAPIKSEIEGFRGLQRLSSYVTVKGKAKRDEAGNLTIIASNIFIKS
ncbi:MAG: hypothetical protein FD167_3206 [bacterium]|nr:MAG: hypothetical protein FD167_3206 [bacterium]